MDRIKAKGWNGIVQLDSEQSGEPMVSLLITTEDGREVGIEIDMSSTLEIVPGLIASLGTLASDMKKFQVLIPAVGWQVDLAPDPPYQPMLHAYLQRSEDQRLSFSIHPDSLRPLARILDRKADELEAKGKTPLAPGSSTRN